MDARTDMPCVEALRDLEARWEAGTLTGRDRERLVALAGAIR